MDLLLIRHARPERRETRDGSPADPPLSPRGREEAAILARWLADEPLDRVVASPMRRALETAAPLARARGLEVAIEPRVAEFDQHASSYVPLEELKAEDPEAWRAFVQGGYGEGLDLDAFRRDLVEALEEIVAASPGRRVAVVCHGGVINYWTAHVLGLAPRHFYAPDYASVSRFVAARSGERIVDALNERPRP
ncbi:MAG: histidine phosphatase family protein [Myxococcota bacterium]|nr:histidine phosphatase family protein [Myxococcota bacterium]